jgi:hypothetical protein
MKHGTQAKLWVHGWKQIYYDREHKII